ncbi:MAG: hypothetical protein JXA18_07185, partial [Chitinispirillaceae bacterium]|nr:hypothetical protein [Chitinispirillaceae bacterium]
MNERMTMPPKVYIFSGSDTVGKEAARNAAQRAIATAAPALVRETFDPADEPFGDFLQKVLTPTLFGDVRLFSINHAELLTDGELDELDRLIAALPDDAYLIIDIGETGKRRGTKTDPSVKLHAADRSGREADRYVYRRFQKPPDYKAAQWLYENVRDWCARTIEKAAAELLVDLAGYDTAVLLSEIRKIDL